MIEAHTQNMEGMRAYGFHTQRILFVDPCYLNNFRNSDRNLEPNTDLTFTLDVHHLKDPQWALSTTCAYSDVQVTLTDHIPISPVHGTVSVLHFEEADMPEAGIGEYMRLDSSPMPYLRACTLGEDGSVNSSVELLSMAYLQALANHLDVPLDRVVLAEAHHKLGQNCLVSDDPDMQKLNTQYCRGRKHRFITSGELINTLMRLERRRGVYYASPGSIVNKGLYYWRELQLRIPDFDRVWATAVYGVKDPNGGLPNEVFEFSRSLGDRIMSMLQLRDELELLVQDSPDNDAEWDIVNRLNYFFVLAIGLFDNLAWLALARYGLLGQYNKPGSWRDIGLQMRDKTGAISTKRFHQTLDQMDSKLYHHILNHQNLIAVFYPNRDSIQHRLVLSGSRVNYLDRGLATIMVHFHPAALSALQDLEPPVPYDVNSWGLFQFADLSLVEPDAFSRQALTQVLAFTQETLRLLDMPAMLATNPDLRAKVDQASPDLQALIAR